jgi:toxin secretion/phage lysis holin
MESTARYLVGAAGAVVSYLFGGWSLLLQVLVVFMVIDYVTGVAVAAYHSKLSSKIGFKGIAKKVSILSLVAVGHLLDQIILGDSQLLRDAVIFFYLANELLSILENVGKTSLAIPQKLKNMIDILKGDE